MQDKDLVKSVITDPTSMFDQGYGIMPNAILFNQELSSSAKLLYVYVSSLCAKTGWCFASNKHFSEKFNIKPRQMTNLLSELHGYLFFETNEKGKRRITCFRLSDKTSKKLLGGTQKIATPTSGLNSTSIKEGPTPSEREQALKLHKGYIRHYKVDRDEYAYATPAERSEMLDKAGKLYKLTDKRLAKAVARLHDAGYELCKKAIVNAAAEEWTHGDNKREWKLDLYKYLFRDYDTVEEWATK
jgi:hypothetical protein